MKPVLLGGVRELAKKILASASPRPDQIYLQIKKGLLVRFTNNGVHQNGFQDLLTYTLYRKTAQGAVYLESNDLPGGVTPGARQFQQFHTANRASQAIEEAVGMIRQNQASANGYYSAYHRFFYLADRGGKEISHFQPAVRFGVTVTKGSGKGYFSSCQTDWKKLRVKPVVEKAMGLAEEASRSEITLKPGVYECIFSPRALLELIEPLRRHFDARLVQDGKSVFSGLRGKKIFSESFTMSEDVRHPRQLGVPFDAEGLSKKRVDLIERGILKELLAEGHSTRGLLEHPFYPENLVIEKGKASLADLFKRTRRGIFINKIWYHALVRENKMEVTGLATAGSLYIEKGEVRGRVVPLRYHDSLFSIFRSVGEATREQILLKDGERGASLFPYLWVSKLKVV